MRTSRAAALLSELGKVARVTSSVSMLPGVGVVPLFLLATLFLCRQDFAGEPLQEYTHLSGRLQISVCLCGLNSLAVYGRGFRSKTGLPHGLPQFTSCRIVSLGSDCCAERRECTQCRSNRNQTIFQRKPRAAAEPMTVGMLQ